MNLLGEPLRVGRLVHTGEREIAPEIVDFYCDTFGDHHPDYAGSSIAPPLLYHSEVYRHVERWYLKNLVGNLHARQEWLTFAPLRIGSRIRTRSTVVERYFKRDREYIVNEVDYTDEEGRLLVRGRTHQSFLAGAGTGGYVVDRSTASAKPRRSVGEGDGPELDPVELLVDRETCWRFSGPEANYHTDPEAARKFGFPDIVVQGMLTTCLVSQVMGNAFGEGWFEGGRMDAKLVNVLWGGERVRARAKLTGETPEGPDRIRRHFEVWAHREDPERTVISVGSASALSG
jgi:acyl dehydratase